MKSSIPVSVERSLHNFESIACEWLSKYSPSWSQSHAKRMARLFERDLFPLLGNRPIADITPPQLLEVLRRIEARGALEPHAPGLTYNLLLYMPLIWRVGVGPRLVSARSANRQL